MELELIVGASTEEQNQFCRDMATRQAKLEELRSTGVNKIESLKNENFKVRKNKELSKEEKDGIIEANKTLIEEARQDSLSHKEEISTLEKESIAITKTFYKKVTPVAKAEWKSKKDDLKKMHKEAVAKINSEHEARLKEIEASKPTDKNDKDAELAYNNKMKIETSNYKQLAFEEKTAYKNAIQKIKNESHTHFLQEYNLLGSLRNGKHSIEEILQAKLEDYVYRFELKDFFIKNGLYLTLLLFMIVCVCITPSVLSINSIMMITQNFSYKIFYALGVAGLILLGGTDLSVGRMVTLGTLITCMSLNPDTTVSFFGIRLADMYSTLGVAGTAIIALILSILMCTLFSAVAGFFSAKFKIHPFISTLATSLTIWGLCAVGTNTIKTGGISTDASKIGGFIGSSGTGTSYFVGFPITIIYAIVIIAIVSLIWNKTKFGKYLYAVGGNPEAASVSGISVFWVTMGAFIMAGVLYGMGGFVTGLIGGSSDSAYGQGWEMEAIAACVVGGISFLGGIGKVSGAVIGCLIFEMLKFFLNRILTTYQVPNATDISNIFIGVIILVAVVFDSLKYLKKK